MLVLQTSSNILLGHLASHYRAGGLLEESSVVVSGDVHSASGRNPTSTLFL